MLHVSTGGVPSCELHQEESVTKKKKEGKRQTTDTIVIRGFRWFMTLVRATTSSTERHTGGLLCKSDKHSPVSSANAQATLMLHLALISKKGIPKRPARICKVSFSHKNCEDSELQDNKIRDLPFNSADSPFF